MGRRDLPETSRRYNKQRRADHRAWLAEQKNAPCIRCGEFYPDFVMDFHHRDPVTKAFEISSSVTRSKRSLSEEIAKCDLYCANCHRIVTHGEQASALA